MVRSVLVSSSPVLRSFLPLDRHGVLRARFADRDLPEILRSNELLLFSLLSLGDFRDFCSLARRGLLRDRQTVLGGAFLGLVKDRASFAQEVGADCACFGRGERFFDRLFGGQAVANPYVERERVSQPEFLLRQPDLVRGWSSLDLVLDVQCRWNRCLFCHHSHGCDDPAVPGTELRRLKEQVILGSAIRSLSLWDNDLSIPFVVEQLLADEELMRPLDSLTFFGVRCTPDVRHLRPFLERYPRTTFDISLGLEFVDQELNDRYLKGYSLERFLRHNGFLLDGSHPNLRTSLYVMIGMPGMDAAYYARLAAFIAGHPACQFKVSWFSMDDAILDNFSGFPELEIGANIHFREFNGMQKLPALRSIYRHYLDHGRTQEEHYQTLVRPSGLVGLPNAPFVRALFPFPLAG